jgi:catechol 2,3-dioxygenase-like lactoylglutathione lyase family enzyme
MEIVCVTVDCRDARAVAAFWSEALGWGGVEGGSSEGEGDVEGIVVCRPPGGGTYLEFVPVPEGKVVKNRVHLGCTAGALDALDAEIERLLALGATVAWEEAFTPEVAARYRNVVLRDPEGNEFCLSGGTYPS